MDALTKKIVTSILLLFLVVCLYALPTSSQWSTCSVTCGDGTQTKTNGDGSTQTRTCNLQSCSTTLTPLTDWEVISCLSPCDGLGNGRTRALQMRECPMNPCEGGALVRFIAMTCEQCAAALEAASVTATPPPNESTTSILTTLSIITDVLSTAEA